MSCQSEDKTMLEGQSEAEGEGKGREGREGEKAEEEAVSTEN